MKKIVLALTVMAILLLIEPLAQVVDGANVPETFARVYSPHPPPYIYVNSTVEIVIDYIVPIDWTEIKSFFHTTDGQGRYTIHSHTSNESGLMYYHINGTMEYLANGNHTYTIYAYFANSAESKPIYSATFTVDKMYRPTSSPIATLSSTPANLKPIGFKFEPTVFGITIAMVIVTAIAAIVLFYLEKH